MKYVAQIVLSVIVCLLVMSGCRKLVDKNQPVYIEQHFKDTFDYKPGTYWVFYDSLTGLTDTFKITLSGGIAPYFDPNNLSANSEAINKFIIDTTTVLKLTWEMEIGAPYYLSITSYEGRFGNRLMYGWPFKTDADLELIPNYIDMNNIYNNVYHKKSKSLFGNTYEIESWVSPQFGLITLKYSSSIIGNKSLHLVAYNIIR